ncbi:MAG TPA: hypothetical protein VF170_08400 [Planctomycetaceae bacterium]
MTRSRVSALLTGAIAASLTAFLTSALLYGLLLRLGDETGSVWAGRIAIVTSSLTVAASATMSLACRSERPEPE